MDLSIEFPRSFYAAKILCNAALCIKNLTEHAKLGDEYFFDDFLGREMIFFRFFVKKML